MDGIPSIYWMLIFSVFTGFVCFVLYQLGMLIKDSRSVIQKAEHSVVVLNGIIKDVNEIVGTVKGTILEVNSAVLVPVRKITNVLSVVSGIAEGFDSKK